ncbi:MAG: TlpA family protein disulfide reductase [SAR202 cluster bacterium]|jgi:DsbE subfamily thiol:disulfide oxidoreductase|nr:TlpA family protein disulfide reductase [SAR202 cluster bacterium AD-802-K11_MRT_200m]MQG75268.1 TlpA family protein disulfide reductase [SAR202 cluster bacterium]
MRLPVQKNSKKLKATVIFLLAMLIAGFTIFLAIGVMGTTTATSRSGKELVGKKAPSFVAPKVGGQLVSLENYKNKPLVLNFWASWCPPCRDETPGMERIWRKYEDQGVVILGINVQDGEKEAERYISEFGVTFSNALDLDGSITVDYGVTGLPVTFFIDNDSVVTGRWVGSISEDRLDNWVSNLIFSTGAAVELDGENLDGYRSLD